MARKVVRGYCWMSRAAGPQLDGSPGMATMWVPTEDEAMGHAAERLQAEATEALQGRASAFRHPALAPEARR